MTNIERQEAAISMALRAAMNKIGLQKIKSGEFFGMKQIDPVRQKEAA